VCILIIYLEDGARRQVGMDGLMSDCDTRGEGVFRLAVKGSRSLQRHAVKTQLENNHLQPDMMAIMKYSGEKPSGRLLTAIW